MEPSELSGSSFVVNQQYYPLYLLVTSFLSFELGPDVRIFGNRVADSELLNQLNRTILEVVNQRVILQTPSVQSQITTAVEFTGLSVYVQSSHYRRVK